MKDMISQRSEVPEQQHASTQSKESTLGKRGRQSALVSQESGSCCDNLASLTPPVLLYPRRSAPSGHGHGHGGGIGATRYLGQSPVKEDWGWYVDGE